VLSSLPLDRNQGEDAILWEAQNQKRKAIDPSCRVHAMPWPPSYKPPLLLMYNGHSEPKQIMMSYEATISSYGGNTIVMAKSFCHGCQEYRPDMVFLPLARHSDLKAEAEGYEITCFQGFPMKPITT
jgi:hypothetical protein